MTGGELPPCSIVTRRLVRVSASQKPRCTLWMLEDSRSISSGTEPEETTDQMGCLRSFKGSS